MPRRRSRALRVSLVVASLGLLAWLAWRSDWTDLSARLREASWTWLAAAVAIALAARPLTAWKWGILLRALGSELRFRSLLQVVWVSNFLGQFLPTAIGGDSVRMISVAWKDANPAVAVTSVGMERLTGLVSLAGLAVLGAAAAATIRSELGSASVLTVVLVGGTVVFAGLWVFLRPTGSAIVRWCLERLSLARTDGLLRGVSDALTRYGDAPISVLQSLGISCLVQLTRVLALWCTAAALAVPLGLGDALMLVPAALFVGMLPVSVGGLGVREGAIVAVLAVAGISSSAAFGVAVVYRLVGMTANLPGALLLMFGHGPPAPSRVDAPESSSWWWRTRARYGPWLVQARALTYGRLRDRRIWWDRRRRASGVRLTAEGRPLSGRLRLPATGDDCPALVLVHGSHGPLPLYELLAHRLSQRGIAVLTVDLPGFGGSPAPPAPWTAEQFTGLEAVAAAMRHLQAHPRIDSGRVGVMGHSFGGSVSARAGRTLPELSTTILLGPTRRISQRFVGASAPDAHFWRARFATARRLEPWPTLALVEEVSKKVGLEYQDEWFRLGHPPLLLIDGALEAEADLAFLRALERRMPPPARLLTIPAADHYLNTAGFRSVACYDRRALETCVHAVVDWVDRHARASADARAVGVPVV